MAIAWMLALLPSAWGAADLQAAQRYALVIGNANYAVVSSLPGVHNDRHDLCATLVKLRFKVTCLEDLATREEFLAVVKRFVSDRPPGAVSMFYYGGHGFQVAGENYLVPAHARVIDRGNLPTLRQLVPLSEVFDIFKQREAGFRFVVLDACRDDPTAARSPGANPPRAPSSGALHLRALMQSVSEQGRVAVSYGISGVRDAPDNTLVLFATAAGQGAIDESDNRRNGPLAKHLLREIEVERQTIAQAIQNLIPKVRDETERLWGVRQSPVIYGVPDSKFCFVSCPSRDPAPVAPSRGPVLLGG